MKSFFDLFKRRWSLFRSIWSLSERKVLFFRDEEKVHFVVLVKKKGNVFVEKTDVWNTKEFKQHPDLKICFSFPRVWRTQIGALLPLEKAWIQDWESPLRDPKQIKKVLPFELQSHLPCTPDKVVFECFPGEKRKETQQWHVIVALKEEIQKEIQFWLDQGIALNFMEWEGNLQAQFVKNLVKEDEEPKYYIEHQKIASHFIVIQKGEIISQSIVVDSSQAEREKRLKVKLISLENKNKNKPLAQIDLSQIKTSYSFLQHWINRDKKLIAILTKEIFSPFFKSINFIQTEIQTFIFKKMLIKNISQFLLFFIIGLGIYQVQVEIKKIILDQKIEKMNVYQDKFINTLSRRTGFSKTDLEDHDKLKSLFPQNDSVLSIFNETAQALSKAILPSYRGLSLEIGERKFILEGETDNFAEVEEIKRNLTKNTNLYHVSLLDSKKREGKVVFRLSAQY